MMQRTRMLKLLLVRVMIGTLILSGGCEPSTRRYDVCQANLRNLEALFNRCQEELVQRNTSAEAMNNMLAKLQSDLEATRGQLEMERAVNADSADLEPV